MLTPEAMLAVALEEARLGLSEGGLPIGAAIFHIDGTLISRGETDAFRNAGRQKSYRDLIMVTTLSPCYYCSGLIRQFGFRNVIVGESETFHGGIDELRALGITITDLADPSCIKMMRDFIAANPTLWNEDIGVD
ncbi:MAG: nucleoside deaminase [Acidobacteriota bacterium]